MNSFELWEATMAITNLIVLAATAVMAPLAAAADKQERMLFVYLHDRHLVDSATLAGRIGLHAGDDVLIVEVYLLVIAHTSSTRARVMAEYSGI